MDTAAIVCGGGLAIVGVILILMAGEISLIDKANQLQDELAAALVGVGGFALFIIGAIILFGSD